MTERNRPIHESNRISRLPALALAVVAMAIGAGGGWWVSRASVDRGIRGLTLAHELEAAGLCANVLMLIEAGSPGRAWRLLHDRLDSAVSSSLRLLDEGAGLGIPAPNLREAPRRAAGYYDTRGDTAGRDRAERLADRLRDSGEGIPDPSPR